MHGMDRAFIELAAFSRLEVKEATDPRPSVGADPPAYAVTLASGTIVVGYLVKAQ